MHKRWSAEKRAVRDMDRITAMAKMMMPMMIGPRQ